MRLQNGLAVPAITYLEAMRWRGPALAAHNAATAGVDAIIAPASPVPAPTIEESDVGGGPNAPALLQRLTLFTRPVNFLGLPSLTVPSGFTKSGLPVGMQLIGRSFDEATLLTIGAAFQRVTDYHDQVAETAVMTKLVEISGLNIRFTGERTVYAVNDLSLSLGDGEVLGLLGESGSGKSVTLRALMRLLPKKRTQITGKVNVMGRDVLAMNDEELSSFRGQTVSMIFQEPALALDPVYTIGAQIAESVVRHEGKCLCGGQGAGARNARGRAHSLGQATARCLSARDVRRHAPARDDCAGARLPSQDLARGRADHRARCHRADPDPAAAARAAARVRHVRHLRHPRHWCCDRDLRPRRGDVCRPDRGAGHAPRHRPHAGAPLRQGPARLHHPRRQARRRGWRPSPAPRRRWPRSPTTAPSPPAASRRAALSGATACECGGRAGPGGEVRAGGAGERRRRPLAAPEAGAKGLFARDRGPVPLIHAGDRLSGG